MRIIIKECRKILDPRKLLMIIIVTVLYYQLFIQLPTYPYIYSWSDIFSQRYVPELVEDIGPSLSSEEWYLMEEKQQELLTKAEEILSANPILAQAGIDNYEAWNEAYQQRFSRPDSELSPEEIRLRQEVITIYEQQDNEARKCLSLLQYIDKLEYLYESGFYFGVPASEAESVVKEYWGYTTPLFQKAMTVFCQRDLSMLPHFMMMLLWNDMKNMTALLVICSLILLVPYQIHERLCEVMPLYATTRTGRGIFGKQFAAELVSFGFISSVQLLIYVGIFIAKGLTVYWKCPAWPDGTTTVWLTVSYGTYMAIYLFMVWLFAMGNVALAYCIGRWSMNYIAGIAASIPAGGIICILGRRLLNSPFAFTEYVRVPMWEAAVLLLWLTATCILVTCLLKRDQKREV